MFDSVRHRVVDEQIVLFFFLICFKNDILWTLVISLRLSVLILDCGFFHFMADAFFHDVSLPPQVCSCLFLLWYRYHKCHMMLLKTSYLKLKIMGKWWWEQMMVKWNLLHRHYILLVLYGFIYFIFTFGEHCPYFHAFIGDFYFFILHYVKKLYNIYILKYTKNICASLFNKTLKMTLCLFL